MRKVQLFLIALVMFQFSCETPEETNFPIDDQTMDYQEVSDDFKEMFNRAFSATESLQLATVSELTEKQATITLEVDNISRAVTDHVEDYFDGLPNGLRQNKIYPLSPSYLFDDQTNKLGSLKEVVNQNNVISDLQKSYILSLAEDIMEVQNYQQGFALIEMFSKKVDNSLELTQDEKLLMTELIAGSEVLLELIESGDIDELRNNVHSEISYALPGGRTTGCSVNIREVWLGGVVGLATGAIAGAIAGATVGTVTVPLLGTVTGAVSGAVVAGFTGFVSGVATEVVGDLLGTCFRSTTLVRSFKSCDQAWAAFTQGIIPELPSNCFTIPISFK